jgi:DNA polymerase III delta prime subunit
MDFNSLWVEKYRPKKIEDLVISDEIKNSLLHFKNTKDIPHLLFTSVAGTGKSSVAKIIVNDLLNCDYLYINASDENGIDTIRNKIISFSQTKSLNGEIKVVICEEFDGMSVDAQRALRNVMEEYASNTRFILTANYKHKIIPAIQSRCQTLDFAHSIKDVAKRCLYILQKESIKIDEGQIPKLQELIKSKFPDIRQTIHCLQKYSTSGSLVVRDNTISDDFIEELFLKLRKEDAFDVREYIIKNETVFQSDYHNLLKNLLNLIYSKDIESLKKKELIIILAEHMYRHTFVIDIEINCFACIINISKLLFGT